MLTEEQVIQMEQNKERYIDLISSIEREGAKIDKLINKLKNSDFFYAPASIKYHEAYEGGLCTHSLNVYDAYMHLIEPMRDMPWVDPICFDDNSIKIVTLLHDISKMNHYDRTIKNSKVYSENGSKRDELGKYDWVSEPGWCTKENAFLYGSHEMTSEYIARQFIPLTLDESVAILHHMGGMHWDSAKDNISGVYGQYTLAVLLHLADMMATYVYEREE